MEFTSLDKRNRVKGTLEQIKTAIGQLKEWNEAITSSEDYYVSPEGMQKLAASCMLIEAIGEGFKQINQLTDGNFLFMRPEIPWEDVMGIRNHIAHGYFDIDGDVIFSSVKNDLDALEEATDFLLDSLA
ncbi:MAG: DUF86 domain-containing protein [Bacteroidaceae bacterium]|nr:DUF86 domain-containing protein [Bacteroidaceae bacterium]